MLTSGVRDRIASQTCFCQRTNPKHNLGKLTSGVRDMSASRTCSLHVMDASGNAEKKPKACPRQLRVADLDKFCELHAENDIGKCEYRVVCVIVRELVTMSSTQRSGKAVASSSRKRAVTSEGKKWYKSHTEAKYFSDVILDDVNLEREFPHIRRRLQELHMGFIFQDPSECNISVVREFYANWKPDARSHFVTVRGVEVQLTPSTINQLLGTADSPADVLTAINISPPYQQIRHALSGAQSTAKWIRHGHRGYHQSYPYAHMNREARVWLKMVMNCLIPGLHFTEVTRDRVCLVYALMKDLPINVGAVLKSAMRKARVHRGRRYAFGGLITNLCRRAGVPEESVDYMAPLFTTPLDITKTKGPENMHGPTLTTAERNRRDEMIMALMFGMEMLRHRNGCRASTQEQLDEVAMKYPLNEQAEALLGLGRAFIEPHYLRHLVERLNLSLLEEKQKFKLGVLMSP
uniref:Putative plant transposon protein domain-containing protein n=1 Tax=Solanum tuberosum TaxID=4113 RepID=M1D8X4_SOLTU